MLDFFYFTGSKKIVVLGNSQAGVFFVWSVVPSSRRLHVVWRGQVTARLSYHDGKGMVI